MLDFEVAFRPLIDAAFANAYMPHPAISIIVPVYKAEGYLVRCIDSILAQTWGDFELILIDDGSPDRCGVICDDYAVKDERVRVLHTANRGVAMARNVGLGMAGGRYIGFVDADDWIEPDMFEVLHRQITADSADLAICSIWYSPVGKRVAPLNSGMHRVFGKQEFARMLSEDVVVTNHLCNKLFTREIIGSFRFPEGCEYEDIHFFTARLPFISKATYLEVPKYHYVQRLDGICGLNKPASRWNCYEALKQRRSWVLSQYPELDGYAVMALIRPGFLVYDGYILGFGVPATQAKQVASDFDDLWVTIRSNPLVSLIFKMKVLVLIKQPVIYGFLRRLYNLGAGK